MKILAIEPYYDGSHKAFIDDFIDRSRHNWTLLTMPARKWKWRMRGSAIEFAKQANELTAMGQKFDAVFATDMMSLTDFTALLAPELVNTPKVLYFHENQITYPCQVEDKRDYHYGLTNIISAHSANSVWFNSLYHKRDFLNGAAKILKKMPDFNCIDIIQDIDQKSTVVTQCINETKSKLPLQQGPLKIVWSARWEHDKNPEDFFAAIAELKKRGVDFRLSVTGQSFREAPAIFEKAKKLFAENIDNWGFLNDPADYKRILEESDIFVSTAIHEFFGISAVEAAAAGCCVMVPQRLAYPEVFDGLNQVFYDGSVNDLTKKLDLMASDRQKLVNLAEKCRRIGKKFQWSNKIDSMDDALEKIPKEKNCNVWS
ncbi:MAG: DUF3524 domain-containing protein [Sedimentisphaeraceae bacterium JB056]